MAPAPIPDARDAPAGRRAGAAVAAALAAGVVALSAAAVHEGWPAPAVHGTVYDAATGTPLSNATVRLDCSDPALRLDGRSGADGRYEISLPRPSPRASACARGTLEARLPAPPPGAEDDGYLAATRAISTQPLVGRVHEDIAVLPAPRIELRGRVHDAATGDLVAGALVQAPFQDESGRDRTPRNVTAAAGTDPRGDNYALHLRHGMPDHVVVTVAPGPAHPQYAPQARQVRIDPATARHGGVLVLDFALSEAAGPLVLVEAGLVHLGNDRYGGSANSQFQLRANGTTRTWTFEAGPEQANSTDGAFRFLAKGVQVPVAIALNGQPAGEVCCSPDDGQFGTFRHRLPAGLLRAGANALTLTAGTTAGEADDIEFTQIVLELP